jgi:hypothetical protein
VAAGQPRPARITAAPFASRTTSITAVRSASSASPTDRATASTSSSLPSDFSASRARYDSEVSASTRRSSALVDARSEIRTLLACITPLSTA